MTIFDFLDKHPWVVIIIGLMMAIVVAQINKYFNFPGAAIMLSPEKYMKILKKLLKKRSIIFLHSDEDTCAPFEEMAKEFQSESRKIDLENPEFEDILKDRESKEPPIVVYKVHV